MDKSSGNLNSGLLAVFIAIENQDDPFGAEQEFLAFSHCFTHKGDHVLKARLENFEAIEKTFHHEDSIPFDWDPLEILPSDVVDISGAVKPRGKFILRLFTFDRTPRISD